ncbi:MAG: pitrilysin family protein [Rikenellaceae bacterium]
MSSNPMDISLKNAECKTLSNGVKLYSISSDEFEVFRVSFVFRAGSSLQSSPFVASTTANLLNEGSLGMSSREIAEKLDFYGSYFDVNIDRDFVYISFCALTKFTQPTLEVAEQILLHPTFPQEEIETYAAKRKQRLSIERTKVETKAREEFAKSLFGVEHPYGISSHESCYDELTRQSIVEFYENHYCAENLFIVCSGRLGSHELSIIERVGESFHKRGSATEVEFPEAISRPYHFIESKEALQASIRIGRLLFTRSHPDFLGMQVVATILGGYFGSRLMQSLREERGYTYGILAAMVNFEREGYFAIATQVGVEVKDDALSLIFSEIERLRQEGISTQELDMVKQIMAGEMMRILDGPFGIADVTIENIMCGTDNSIIEQNLLRIMDITPEEISRLANKYLARESLVTVVSGGVER